jgi:hypothetical protein
MNNPDINLTTQINTRRNGHDVLLTSTARHPRENGWLIYTCQTCQISICAADYIGDNGSYSIALTDFKLKHPCVNIRQSQWAQPK